MIKLLPLCKTFTLIPYSCKLSACYFKTFCFKVHSFLRKRLDKGHGICLETTFANLLVARGKGRGLGVGVIQKDSLAIIVKLTSLLYDASCFL